MVNNPDEISFYIIKAGYGTVENHFPADSAGVLLAMNLYNSHIIQVYFALIGPAMYMRTQVSRAEWSQWSKL